MRTCTKQLFGQRTRDRTQIFLLWDVLVGDPKHDWLGLDVRAVRATRSQAIAALKAELEHRIELGELISLDISAIGVSSLAGKYRTDPTLREICTEAYRMRDAERGE